jgi:hypothetical protein
MSKRVRKITVPALMASLSIVFIYLASVFPTGQLGLIAVSSLFGIAAVIETGLISGILVYVASSILALIVVPNKLITLIYVMFFGYYPVLKSIAERVKNRVFEWVIKLLVFNGALTLMMFTIKSAIIPQSLEKIPSAVIYIGANVVFAVFDFGVSKLIAFYLNRISKNIRR